MRQSAEATPLSLHRAAFVFNQDVFLLNVSKLHQGGSSGTILRVKSLLTDRNSENVVQTVSVVGLSMNPHVVLLMCEISQQPLED